MGGHRTSGDGEPGGPPRPARELERRTITRDVRVAGRHYRFHESGTAAPGTCPIVLLHGIGMTHRSFARVQLALPPDRRVLSVELAGFGSTERPRHRLDIEDYAADLGEALAGLDAGPAVVVGHSMGTQFAVEFARIHPRRVQAMVLVGPVVDPRRRTPLRQAIDLLRDTLGEPIPTNALVMRDYLRAGPRWYFTEFPVMLGYPMLERIGECSAPAVIVRGEREPIARHDWCLRLVEASGGPARLVTASGQRHVVPRTAPEVLVAELVRLSATSDEHPGGAAARSAG